MISFVVRGIPRPKQSFRIGKTHGYTEPRVKAWQELVYIEALRAMNGRPPLTGDLAVWLDFYLPDRRRRDNDNLAKGVLDACNGVVWVDDSQITQEHIYKSFASSEHGVTVTVGDPEEQI